MAQSPVARSLGSVLVLGLGHTGAAVTRLILDPEGPVRADSVTVVGGVGSKEGDLATELRDLGAEVLVGTEEIPGTYDVAIASPGISEFSDFYRAAAAASSQIMGEPEFAWRLSPERWIAITGTNGKTTTTELTGALLRAAGLDAECVGNIGVNVTDEVIGRPQDRWFVAELSSFQLATTSKLHPRVAALLNITPDHLEWHRTHEAYVAAKEKVFANLDGDDLAVVVVDDPTCAAIACGLEERAIPCCAVSVTSIPDSPQRAYVDDGSLVVEDPVGRHDLGPVSALSIQGAHNVANALVASACALFCGATDGQVRAGLAAFSPLEHRVEPCGEVRGIRFVNDSKATNTDAVVKAVSAFEPGRVICLLGGHDKGTDLSEFATEVMDACRDVVCYGEAQDRFHDAFEAVAPGRVHRAPHMVDALKAAYAMAVDGDVVLLSPACSSYDEFSGYEERGRVFKGAVADLIATEGDRG